MPKDYVLRTPQERAPQKVNQVCNLVERPTKNNKVESPDVVVSV